MLHCSLRHLQRKDQQYHIMNSTDYDINANIVMTAAVWLSVEHACR